MSVMKSLNAPALARRCGWLLLLSVSVSVNSFPREALSEELPGNRWPAFLGQGADISQEGPAAPLEWSPEDNLAWRKELPGYGQSSPIAWGDWIYVIAVEGEMKETLLVISFDLTSGDERWRKSFKSSLPMENSLYVSRAAPTPVCDAGGLYCFFESGDVIALSHEGETLWTRSLGEDYGKFQNEFGLSGSPVLAEDKLIILVDDQGPSYLLALKTATGETTWKTERDPRRSWSSPAVLTLEDGATHIVCSSGGGVQGYSAKTGELVWRFDDVGGNTATTPVPTQEGLFLIGASPGRRGENAEMARKSNLAMVVERTAAGYQPVVKWRTEEASVSWASPMIHQGFAYWVNRAGVVFCFDAATGEQKYAQRIGQPCWATPIGFGARVYFFGKSGLTTVLKAGPEFEVLAENELWDPDAVTIDESVIARESSEERRRAAAMFAGPTQYGVAVVPGGFLVRTGRQLTLIRE